MSAKDLNLSFDRELARARDASSGPAPVRNERGGIAEQQQPASGRPPPRKALKRASRPAKTQQWVMPAVIALANMVFLVVAGIWLTGTSYPRVPARDPAAMAAAPQAEADLSSLQTQLDVMQQQLVGLQSTLEEQQRLLLFTRLEAMQPAGADQTDAEDAAASPEKASPAWQINLGHFDTRDEAVSMQRELAALGYTADIATADDAGVTLLLGGFGERKLAELAAKDIMQRTRLNGLWVSGGK